MQKVTSKRKIAADGMKLLSSSVITKIIGGGVGILVAKVLGPADFGLLKIINFVPSLAKYANIGFGGVYGREVPHIRAVGGGREAEQRVADTAFSTNIFWGAGLAIIVFLFSFCYSKPFIRFGLWISALSLFITQLNRLYAVKCSVNKLFSIIAVVAVVGSLVRALVIVTTVYWGRGYSVLFATLFSVVAGCIYYLNKIRLSFRFTFDKEEFFRLLKISIPLASGTAASGLFQWAEYILVISLYGSDQLGIYVFALFILDSFRMVLNSLLRAGKIHLYEALASKSNEDISYLVEKIILSVTYVLAPLIGFCCLTVPPVINYLMPEFNGIEPLMPWLGAAFFINAATMLPLAAMNSKALNMQTPATIQLFLRVGVFLIMVFSLSNWEMGVVTIAIAKVVTELSRMFSSYLITSRHLFGNIKNMLTVFGKSLLLLFVSLAMVYWLDNRISSNTLWNVCLQNILFLLTIVLSIFLLDMRAKILLPILKKKFLRLLKGC
ncbi:MAG: hypothetical protein CMB97_00060 [Flavobacteriaceae bacterium]|nr:hypothetical protein [Flavobacteriaceae bacterium]